MKNVVLYIGSIFLPDKSAGAQRSLSLSKSFRALGYDVIIAGMDADLRPATSILETEGECMGFKTYAVAQPKTIKQWVHHTLSAKEYIKIIENVGAENVAFLVAMEYEAIPLWKLSRYCKKHNIELIADAEEWYENSKLPFPMNIAKDFDTNLRMRYVYPRCIKNMICISRFFESHYKDKVQNQVYIPGTIDPSEEKWDILPEYLPNEILTLGYAGSPGLKFEKERFDWLLEAVIELNKEDCPCKLMVAGVEKDFIKQIIGELEIPEEVVFKGKLSHQECLSMVASCDFTVIAREDKRVTKAGFPTKFSESFGCGTPVITTASSNVAEYIEEGKTGFLCSDFSKNSIKDAIKKAALLNKDELKKIHTELKKNNPLVYKNFNDDLDGFLKSITEE